ncbi:hypothetical protein EUX98_g6511 [Antrodiella citrinella]|uniref:Amino acid permease/ SLC12A domain-containing protein n=1 Tax=Antrodiella citrinella TaxID=2447956 RepID=A0A4S4MP50_9APHY|nr:hypothetical protein EUX98_g6511 [Antrodiella citrinella]
MRSSDESQPLLDTHGKRQLGLVSASFLIFNRVIGTGYILQTLAMHKPQLTHTSQDLRKPERDPPRVRERRDVLADVGVGRIGSSVRDGGLHRARDGAGGEKIYLEYIFRKPMFLASSTYAIRIMLMFAFVQAWQSASATVFGEYLTHAISPNGEPLPVSTRFISLCCLTFAFIVHGTRVQWGIHIGNTLATIKLLVLFGMGFSGLAVLAGMKGFELEKPPNNFEWSVMWAGTASGGTNAFVTGMYNVIWSFIGYSNANYALSEVRNPVRTIKLAAPTAMFLVTAMYLLVNVAYYAVVDKEAILGSGRIAAALFFGRLWGTKAERLVSVVIACSTMGNVLAVLFSQSRVIQELGREGILPFSSFFASSKPFGTPLAGLFAQWLVTSLVITVVPSGDAYLFMLNMSSYPLSLINMFVSAGLILLHTPLLKYDWDPPFRSYHLATVFFFLSNVFLVFAPLIPPAAGFRPYEKLPYWLHVVVASSISVVGVTYWYVKFRWLPARGGYTYVHERVVQDDGATRNVIRKIMD